MLNHEHISALCDDGAALGKADALEAAGEALIMRGLAVRHRLEGRINDAVNAETRSERALHKLLLLKEGA